MFCSKCGGLMMPKEGKMKCSCGYVQQEGKISDKQKKSQKIEVMDEKSTEVLPKMKYDCKSCSNNEAYFWTLQTRSSDEPETRFFKCTKCSTVHREY